jgi:AcrR family transcriptional regulator
MRTSDTDISLRRRDQVVEAAMAIIAEQGIQCLSLSEIEKRAGMSRGQLTYYFPTKESILLAVFDRVLERMYQRMGAESQGCFEGSFRDRFSTILRTILTQPPANPEFSSLQYTFLSQLGHREDFRERLATLYGEWRGHMAGDLGQVKGQTPRSVSPRTLASLVQAILHGIGVQLAADPNAFDRQEMTELCFDLVTQYLGAASAPHEANGSPRPRGPKR